MIKLIVFNTITKLVNVSDEDILPLKKKIHDVLSYKKPGSEFSKAPEWLKWVRLYSLKTDQFPTGLLYKVQEYLDLNSIEYEVDDQRQPEYTDPQYHYMKQRKTPELRPYQKEALEALDKNPRGVIEAITGSGKSLIIQELIYRKGLRTLLITPSSNILSIFEEKLSDVFGSRHVGILTGGKKQLDKPITISTYQSLPKIPPEWFQTVQMVITDECHHSAADTLYELNIKHFQKIYYRYGFSATFFRNDSSEMSLQGVLSDVIYKYNYQRATKEKYLCRVKFHIIENYNGVYCDNWREEVKEALTLNDKYNDMVAMLAKGFDAKKIPTIVFVNEIEHGNQLHARIPNSVFICGNETRADNKKTLADFNDRKFNVLIGTSVIGEGVDTVPAQIGILASGFKAESEVIQKIGRLLRPCEGKDRATFIDFMNIGTKYMNKHYKQRLRIYKSYKEPITHTKL